MTPVAPAPHTVPRTPSLDTLLHGWPRSPFPRPDRKDEPARFGKLGAVRQRIESVFATCKDQLGLERHGARTLPGLGARIGLRLLALTAALWHNHHIGDPGRHLAAYSH